MKFVKEPLSKSKLKRLIALVDGPNALNPESDLEAIEMSIAKWHPSRGEMQGSSKKDAEDSCGCCRWFLRITDGDCEACPLKGCGYPYDSPYNNWEDADTDEERTRWANIIHYILLCAWNVEKGFVTK